VVSRAGKNELQIALKKYNGINLGENIHMNGVSHCRDIDIVGIEFECLFLFILLRKECCCVGHGEICLDNQNAFCFGLVLGSESKAERG
jgi:hypothetical protein